MKTIYKFPLELTDYQEVEFPSLNAPILDVQMQGGKICIWAIVRDDTQQPHKRKFHIIGTGNPFPDISQFQYIGTVQQMSGSIFDGFNLSGIDLVWHVFEEL